MSRCKGHVAKWLNHKGIGFITPDGETEGENDILVHYEQIKQETEDGFKSLAQGSKVEYELAEDPKNSDKQIAIKVSGPDGADAERKGAGKRKGEGKREKGEGKSSKGGKKGEGKKGKGKGKKGKGKKGDDEDDDEEEE